MILIAGARHFFPILITGLICAGCVSNRIRIEGKNLGVYINKSEILGNSLSGFLLMDPNKNNPLLDFNGHRLFIPASNTKIFTFYAAKNILGDSLPSIAYAIYQDTLFFTGMGDPTFLHPDFEYQPAFEFLARSNLPLVYVPNLFMDRRFGPGWAWDDFPFAYSAEKSELPVYGNLVWLKKEPADSTFRIIPRKFYDRLEIIRDTILLPDRADSKINREEFNNKFIILYQEITDSVEAEVPFMSSLPLIKILLEDTLKKEIRLGKKFPEVGKNIIHSQPSDSLLRPMMVESDNFFAEQILLMSSSVLKDTLDSEKAIKYAIKNFFTDISGEMYWADGSGLSRYNQFSPHAVSQVLKKIYQEYGKDYITGTFPIGGVSGTMKENFPELKAFVIAKTGSMLHVYNLSGFLITDKGRWLIFSFMNNNFIIPPGEVRKEITKILQAIKKKY